MNSRIAASVVLFALALAGVDGVPAAGAADGEAAAIQAGHRTFAADYVAAVNSREVERLRRLVHPKSLACVTDQNRDFFDDMAARALRGKLAGPYRVVSVRVLGIEMCHGGPLEPCVQILFHAPHEPAGQHLQIQAISELRRDDELEQALIADVLPSAERHGEVRKFLVVRECRR